MRFYWWRINAFILSRGRLENVNLLICLFLSFDWLIYSVTRFFWCPSKHEKQHEFYHWTLKIISKKCKQWSCRHNIELGSNQLSDYRQFSTFLKKSRSEICSQQSIECGWLNRHRKLCPSQSLSRIFEISIRYHTLCLQIAQVFVVIATQTYIRISINH
jgi:hypothetical protein